MALGLDISNVVTISVSAAPAGLDNFSINNLLIVTKEIPVSSEVAAADYGVYRNANDVGIDWGTDSVVYTLAQLIFSQSPNILTGGGELIIQQIATSGVTLATAMGTASNTLGLFYGGVVPAYFADGTEIAAAATYAQTNRKLLFVGRYQTADLAASGVLYNIHAANQHYARGLFYSLGESECLEMAAAYAGRAMSTDFSGSQTTQTMHMKDLANVVGDTGLTQTILNNAKTVGADTYGYYVGLPKVFSTGANEFYDDVYNLNWIFYALQVAGFNAIAQTSTKIPQTEPGIAALTGAYLDVVEQGVSNGFIAPGRWTSSDTFGNPDDFRRNILENGYYIYSLPVTLQTRADREAREAPLIQIGIKFSGAVHSSSVIIYANP